MYSQASSFDSDCCVTSSKLAGASLEPRLQGFAVMQYNSLARPHKSEVTNQIQECLLRQLF